MRADALRLESVSLTYPGAVPVDALRDVDLSVGRGEFVGVLGPSGAGKSSLLQVLGLLITPTTGRVLLDGVDTSLASESERTGLRSRHIGFVFQAFHLIEGRSAVENVALPLRYQGVTGADASARALAVLEAVGLRHRAHHACRALSGGERQRVAIARALVTEPDVLLCDEPTGNLDSTTSASVLGLLANLHQSGRTIILITHDAVTASYAQRRVEIHDGTLTAEAHPNDDTHALVLTPGDPAPKQAAPRGVGVIRPLALLDEALAGLAERRTRSILTSIGVVLGIATVVAIIGLAATASGQVSERFDRLVATTVSTSVRIPGGMAPERVARAARLNGVTGVGTLWSVIGAEITPASWDEVGPAARSLDVQAVTAETWPVVAPHLLWGRMFDAGQDERQVAVLGSGAARQLGIQGPLGTQSVLINHEPFLVLGVFDDVERRPDLLMSVVVPAGLARAKWGEPPTSADLAEVLVGVNPGAGPQVASELPYALMPEAPSAVVAIPPPNPRELREDVGADLTNVFLGIGLVTLIVGMLGIANTSLVTVMERFREIGLRRAIGARQVDIRRQFVLEAAIIGTVGGLLGALLGVVTVVSVSLIQDWTPLIDQRVMLAAPLLGVMVGAIAGYVPSRRASKIDPAETVRQ